MGTGIDIDFPGFHRLYDDGWILLFFFLIHGLIVAGIPARRGSAPGLLPLRFAPPCETVGPTSVSPLPPWPP